MVRIGKYIVRGLLGRGGMSKVFKAEIPHIGKIVAVKLLDPHPVLNRIMGEDAIRDLFFAEASKMARLDHPHIAAIRDFDEMNGRLFYVMDYYFSNVGQLIGETWRTEEPSRTIRLDRAVDLIRQTLSALACLHHHGIIHRDVKPFNLLLDDQQFVKLSDLGLSRLRGEIADAPQHLKVGSPWYAAPEQESNPRRADARADLYAAGVTLYRMLTGRLPGEPVQPPSVFNPDLDPGWDEFILRAIAKNPAQRYENAGNMLEVLNRLDHAWQARRDAACLMAQYGTAPLPAAGRISSRLRSEPSKLDSFAAKTDFGVDTLWRPRRYLRNRFVMLGEDCVRDEATGLVWQQSGSPYSLSWREAHDYVAGLDRDRFASQSGWRLPTAPELLSLLRPTPHAEDFCIEPVFDPDQRTLWSCDRRSFIAGWFVNVEMGFVSWQDMSARCFARAVRSG